MCRYFLFGLRLVNYASFTYDSPERMSLCPPTTGKSIYRLLSEQCRTEVFYRITVFSSIDVQADAIPRILKNNVFHSSRINLVHHILLACALGRVDGNNPKRKHRYHHERYQCDHNRRDTAKSSLFLFIRFLLYDSFFLTNKYFFIQSHDKGRKRKQKTGLHSKNFFIVSHQQEAENLSPLSRGQSFSFRRKEALRVLQNICFYTRAIEYGMKKKIGMIAFVSVL